MERLRRKIDDYLIKWKLDEERLPLIVKGARQIGKTNAIKNFGEKEYEVFLEINFALQPEYKTIFDSGFEVDSIIKNISLKNPTLDFIPYKTLIFFDEMQECSNAATSLKAFREDGRYDVICSGSLMGINYMEIESNSVGNKIDYTMYSLDFEEFLWAKGYKDEQIEDMYNCMRDIRPLAPTLYNVMLENFKEYMVIGGMPEIIKMFIKNNNYNGILQKQQQILIDYEEDITKYAGGLDKGKILSVYRKIPVFLGKDNKKFQITKVEHNARSRDYVGVVDWLKNAGIVNVCYAMECLELPLKGNYIPNNFKLYFGDNGLLIGSLEEEAQRDLRNNENFNTYKGAIYENIVADMLVKSGYDLFFYKDEQKKLEMDFFVRNERYLIPVEVKASDNSTLSLNKLVSNKRHEEIKFGIKLCNKNIGFNGTFYTFPYFLTFLLKRFLLDKDFENKN